MITFTGDTDISSIFKQDYYGNALLAHYYKEMKTFDDILKPTIFKPEDEHIMDAMRYTANHLFEDKFKPQDELSIGGDKWLIPHGADFSDYRRVNRDTMIYIGNDRRFRGMDLKRMKEEKDPMDKWRNIHEF